MAKNKNNQAIWNTRIKKNASSLFQKVGNSIDIDKRLYKEDIQGSIAHVEMLFKQKIISFKIKNKIIYGLTKINKEITNNKFDTFFFIRVFHIAWLFLFFAMIFNYTYLT